MIRLMMSLLGALALLACPAMAQTTRTVPTYTNQSGTEVPAAGVFLLGSSTYYTDTTTALASAGTYVGTTRAVGMGPQTNSPNWARHAWFVAEAWSDQAGTLFVEKSINGGQTWSPVNGTAGTAVAAGTTVTVAARVTAYQYRVRYVNGATLQGSFVLTSALTSS